MPTLLLPKKATSGNGDGGKERKCAALKSSLGGTLWKKREAYFSWAIFGGVEIVYEFKVTDERVSRGGEDGFASGIGSNEGLLGSMEGEIVTCRRIWPDMAG